MGTTLLERGLPPDLLPEAWVLSRPDEVAAVHAAHAAAGAQLLLTCTFNAASPRLLGRLGPIDLPDLAARAVALARRASPRALVAGAVGAPALARPLGEAAPPVEVRRLGLPALRALAEAGVDLLWLESLYDQREAGPLLEAALGLGRPVVVTFSLAERAGALVTPDGGRAEPLLLAAARAGAAAVGVNCVAAGPALEAMARWAGGALPVPFVAKPSAGLPGREQPPAAFGAAVARLARLGARLVGGCCGAGPGHVDALAAALRDEGVWAPGVGPAATRW